MIRTVRKATLAACAGLAVVVFAACTSNAFAPITGPLTPLSGKDDRGNLTGAGATFPALIYQAWFYNYHDNVAPGVKINYQSIGSGGGIQQFIEGVVDFGATDAPMSDENMARAKDAQHLPTVLGAVTITYNLAGLSEPLKLDGATTADIFLGKIRTWDDPPIKALNPGVALPSQAIHVVHRSDGSGTSFVFTDWLSKVSSEWQTKVGKSKNPNWPVGIGGKGNEGVTQVVKQTPGSIAYVELNYARSTKLPVAAVKNKAGAFVAPTLDSVSAAAAGVQLPDDYRVSITNADGEASYPISTFTFLLVHKHSDDCTTARVLLHFLWWAYHDPAAIQTVKDLDYAPLPPPAQAKVDETLKSLTCEGGEKVLGG